MPRLVPADYPDVGWFGRKPGSCGSKYDLQLRRKDADSVDGPRHSVTYGVEHHPSLTIAVIEQSRDVRPDA